MRLFKLAIVVAVIFITAMTSCNSKNYFSIQGLDNNENKETFVSKIDTITLNILSEENPIPSISQIICRDSIDYYVALDNQAIYEYNILADSLYRILPLGNLPPINNLSGFTCTEHGYIIYEYNGGNIFKLDLDGNILSKISVLSVQTIDPWGIQGTPVLSYDNTIYLSGPPSSRAITNNKNITSIAIDLTTKKYIEGGTRPEIYDNIKIGTDYYWRVFQTLDGAGNLVLSIPASPYIYIFNKNMDFLKMLPMGSHFKCDLIEANNNMSIVDEKLYYLQQSSYGSIEYDKYAKVFHRVVTHKLDNIKMGGRTLKPFSIITMDENGDNLSETPIFYHDNTLYYDVFSSTPNGTYIQMYSENENIIKFLLLKF